MNSGDASVNPAGQTRRVTRASTRAVAASSSSTRTVSGGPAGARAQAAYLQGIGDDSDDDDHANPKVGKPSRQAAASGYISADQTDTAGTSKRPIVYREPGPTSGKTVKVDHHFGMSAPTYSVAPPAKSSKQAGKSSAPFRPKTPPPSSPPASNNGSPAPTSSSVSPGGGGDAQEVGNDSPEVPWDVRMYPVYPGKVENPAAARYRRAYRQRPGFVSASRWAVELTPVEAGNGDEGMTGKMHWWWWW
ncbi:hypothetical protein QBC35DRAFT_252305 [Podospora australis]|uniref:Uncharacterized protein n=1 Tax=Podospora australis TaxID=1536484 RepID=A0AAN6WRK8_9PEZI|nr:hypothetical protein QBC35DRAFT_252305 [Podospora australis]